MPATPPLARSLAIQFRVLRAIILREVITRYGRDNLGVLWLFFEPMLFTVGVLGLWTLMGIGGHQLPIAAFCVTGYSSVLLWRNCANRASMAIPPNHGLLYHRNVRVLDLLMARIILEVVGAMLSFIILTCFFVYIGVMEWPDDLLKVVFGWMLLSWFGASLAILIGAASAFSQVVERLWHPAAYLFFPLAGAVYLVDWLPLQYQQLALYIPTVSGLELMREGYFGDAMKAHYDLVYMMTFCLGQTLLALWLVRQAGQHVELQ